MTRPRTHDLAAHRADHFLSFASLLDGTIACDSPEWVYTLRASALIDDPLGATCYRNALNAGRMTPDAHPDTILGRCALADPRQMDTALHVARRAAAEWGGSAPARRARVAEAFRARLHEHAATLTGLLVEEGHPVRLARMEVGNLLTFFGPETTDWCLRQMETRHSLEGRTVELRRVPDGVVCVQPPLNTPALSVGAAFQCVLAGNALVVRLPRQAPIAAMYLLQRIAVPALADAGAPPGVLSALCTDPAQALDTWLASPLVDDVLYFGDSVRGEQLEKACLAAGKKPVLELGGNDMVLVWRDAPLEHAVELLMESFHGGGQICCAPNIALVHPEIADALADLLTERVRTLRPGFPDDPEVVLAASPHMAGYDATLADARKAGARVLTGGRHLDVNGRESDIAVFVEPALVRADGLAHARRLRAVRHETFFPLLTLVVPDPARDDDLLTGMTSFVASGRYGLRNSLLAQDPKVIDHFVREVRSCGQLRVNDSHLAGVAYLSNHGGPGLSGDRHGELNYPMLRTSRLQGVSVAQAPPLPRETIPYVPASRPRVEAKRSYPPGWPPEDLPGGLPAPFTEAFQHDPYPTLHWLREHRPVSRIVSPDGPGWLLTRYGDVRQAHTDPRVTCDSTRTTAGRTWLRHWPDDLRERLFTHLLDSDDPRHADLRAIMRPFFTPARQEQWRARVQHIVDTRIDRIADRGHADLMAAVAYPLGGNVLFSVLGAAPPQMDHLRAMIWRTADWNNEVPYVAALAYEIDAFVRKAVAEKRRSPGDDLISLLVTARDRDGLLSEDELHGQVMMMLAAGQDPSINSVGNSLHALLSHPDQLAALLDDLSLIEAGINELLRYESPLPFTSWRGTLEPVEFGEVTVPADESLFLCLGAANRDPARYPDPDRLDLRRPTRSHLAFGHGSHYCLGAHIGRITAETAVVTVLRRLPGLRLDGTPQWRPSMFERGLSILPVAWDEPRTAHAPHGGATR
ncbi:aldehyde dehydrogenase family protein [Streptomyces sp. TRM76323]|uniref:Aldehyde dehydrogenase family protein n=1 Tax=Streptomyces tamarix TaxID=3078565 RepID=A0ABU3QHV9_9ACTN|nr:aldehyde dehydrogenase family protein [Streptomyces tamarix]MDT9682343.1 aldehyde dehydrogenase family protein [Streptomyces tamarix]